MRDRIIKALSEVPYNSNVTIDRSTIHVLPSPASRLTLRIGRLTNLRAPLRNIANIAFSKPQRTQRIAMLRRVFKALQQ